MDRQPVGLADVPGLSVKSERALRDASLPWLICVFPGRPNDLVAVQIGRSGRNTPES